MEIIKFLVNLGFYFFVGAVLSAIFLYLLGFLRKNHEDKDIALFWKTMEETAEGFVKIYLAGFVVMGFLKVIVGA